jgi:predicted enzyme related to lactoylglutathione lyase
MQKLNLIILYVDNPTASAAFYGDLLGQPPTEASPTFAMFSLPSGVGVGLWSRHTVEPAVTASSGCTELAFTTSDVDAVHAEWARRGLPIAQAPTDMDFGRTFVALDPDGHRLRVFAPATP